MQEKTPINNCMHIFFAMNFTNFEYGYMDIITIQYIFCTYVSREADLLLKFGLLMHI